MCHKCVTMCYQAVCLEEVQCGRFRGRDSEPMQEAAWAKALLHCQSYASVLLGQKLPNRI